MSPEKGSKSGQSFRDPDLPAKAGVKISSECEDLPARESRFAGEMSWLAV